MSTKHNEPVPAGAGAKVLPGAHVGLLEAYGDAFGAAVREVYRPCVVSRSPEPWFVPADVKTGAQAHGLRCELIAKGWSQREATAIHTTAMAAQSSAVESTKLALDRSSGSGRP